MPHCWKSHVAAHTRISMSALFVLFQMMPWAGLRSVIVPFSGSVLRIQLNACADPKNIVGEGGGGVLTMFFLSLTYITEGRMNLPQEAIETVVLFLHEPIYEIGQSLSWLNKIIRKPNISACCLHSYFVLFPDNIHLYFDGFLKPWASP